MSHFDFDQKVPLCVGDLADIYLGHVTRESEIFPAITKLAREATLNPLLIQEAHHLARIRQRMLVQKSMWVHSIPRVFGSFSNADGDKLVNILEYFPGFFSVHAIRTLYEATSSSAPYAGVDGRTMAWMWRRLLILMDWTHKIGLVHGALLPPHILYYPDNNRRGGHDQKKHSVRVVDWCYSTDYSLQQTLPAVCSQWAEFYPPEVGAKFDLGPWTDLYMAAKTMVYITGGVVSANQFPPSIDPRLAQCILRCLDLSRQHREQSAKEQFERFDAVLKEVFGEPKFHDFILPGI
jgi:serine/threonine protein kinase